MAKKMKDWEFRLRQVTHVDFKQITMDRVLTSLFERIRHSGCASRLPGRREVTVEKIREEFLTEQKQWFEGFDRQPQVFDRWIESALLDMVNRGEPNQAVAAPRPLHGYTYRFRDPYHSRDNGAARQIYELLHNARHGRGQAAIDALRKFFFAGIDLNTDRVMSTAEVDVETQALLRLCGQVRQETAAPMEEPRPAPACLASADLLADDVLRLLLYGSLIPRSVLVDYLKILLSFHLGLYHLRLLKMLPALLRQRGTDGLCAAPACPVPPRDGSGGPGPCPHRLGLLVDVTAVSGMPMARLGARSADMHYRRIPGFIRAVFTLRKLDEMAAHLVKLTRLTRPPRGHFTIPELLALLGPTYEQDRRDFFGNRLAGLLESDEAEEKQQEIQAIVDLKLDSFETYIELLLAYRTGFHRKYITQFLDSALLKNQPGALLAQTSGAAGPRRFVLDSRLLEVLLQLAVLRPAAGPQGFTTTALRVDDLLEFLRQRYGLYVDRLPTEDGFDEPGMEERQALRANVLAFKDRLREIGFYRDLSDAYVTQTVTPRYYVGPGPS